MGNPFAALGWLGAAILAGCLAAGRGRTASGGMNWLLAVAVLLWAAYGYYEAYVVDPRANIRVDLLIIGPVLLGAAAAGLLRWRRA